MSDSQTNIVAVPSASSSSTYQKPIKKILSPAHLAAFQRSSTHAEVLSFITDLNESIVGKKLSEADDGSERTQTIMKILDTVLEIAKETPPVDNKLSRFGNPAFKTFYDRVSERSDELHRTIIGLPEESIVELKGYFDECWGNRERVDYGSGMELNFVCWLLCLLKLGLLNKEDYAFLVLGVFWRYINVMRHLQSTYWLEPAGSHGVWGLDDYHFLPFLWGSGQLRDHRHLRPKAIHDPEVLEAFSADYMYLACIQFINSIKTASLRWHSPMLDDISAVKTWSKVNEGMLKMFKAEVLGKLPVMQHFMFGSLLPFVRRGEDAEFDATLDAEEKEEDKEATKGHRHGEGWTQDCCGIPVPSAFAQAQGAPPGQVLPGGVTVAAGGGTTNGPASGLFKPRQGIKPIPFD